MEPEVLHMAWLAADGSSHEEFSLRWENGGWVAEGRVSGPDVHYVLRLGPDFATRQFLLFRDLSEADLWLVTDGNGRWAEMNGAERTDLAGCDTIDVGCTPSTNSIPIRNLGLEVGASKWVRCAWVDVETLEVVPDAQRYTRLGEQRWRFESPAAEVTVEFDVDEHGVVLDYPGRFVRIMPNT